MMERTLLRAPFDGIVAEINGELGEFVTPSPVGIPTPPAVDVVDTSCIYVTAPIDEVDAPRIREGMQARVTLDAFRDRSFPARVRRVAPYVLDLEKQARTVEIEAELERVRRRRPAAGLQRGRRSGAAETPRCAAHSHACADGGQSCLRVRSATGACTCARSRPALRNWEYTEVTQGSSEGDAW